MSVAEQKKSTDVGMENGTPISVVHSPTSSPPPPFGRSRIGRYEIIYPIAQGGMASVYAGRLSGMAGFQRLVAIKVVHSHLSSEDNFIRMFLDEARLSAGIHHPNVGEVYEVGEDDGIYYMVAELILGQSLRAVFRRAESKGIPVPPALSARIAAEVCKGLHAAHELTGPDGASLGLVHRDVSPRNVLLTYSGFVKLIDFGVAYAQGRISQTDVGTLKGKIGYMSPEQLRCEPLDRRSDVFSLGVLLYQLVTGNQPFAGKTDFERLNRILQYQFQKPRESVPALDPRLEEIILTAMARHPDGRYATAAAMAEALEQYVRQSGEPADAGVFTALMNELFAVEQAYHFEKIRDWREVRRAKEDPGGSDPMKQTDPALPRAIAARRREEQRSGRSKGRAASWWGLGAVAAGLLLAGLLVPAFFGRNADGGDAVASAAEKPDAVRAASEGSKAVEAAVARGGPQETAATGAASESAGPRTIVVSLDIAPETAMVFLDGVAVAPGTETVQLPADGARHVLRITAEGFREKTVTLTADEDLTMTVSLVPKAKKKGRGNRGAEGNGASRRLPLLEASPYR